MRSLLVLLVGMSAFAITGCAPAESADDAPPSVVMGPEGGDHLEIPGGEFRIYVDPETYPEARASFGKFSLDVGAALPVHRHDKTEEVGYFLSGQGVVTIFEDGEAKDIPVGEGHVVYVRQGSWHTIKNTGDEPFSLVFATIPNEKKGLMSFFRRIAIKPGEEPTPLSQEEFARLAAEHDLILKSQP